jgi:divalent metal cation (Fe/Co/Zn/Cd) transporter
MPLCSGGGDDTSDSFRDSGVEHVNKTEKSAAKTLLMSVLFSSPGPIVVFIGLFIGRSSTQLADFIRRTIELVAIIVSYCVYKAVHKDGEKPDPIKKQSLERMANAFVGAAMCISGSVMLGVSLFSTSSADGNVILGLAVATLGMFFNIWFWLRYRRLNRAEPDKIMAAQARLYSAKSFVDICVFSALLTVALASGTALARLVDTGGSVIVSGYLVYNGIKTLMSRLGKP